tara:strand:- start:573 stop:1091 length:519 start_codon:yes stop_codon:yes gene_type:complete
MHKIYKPVILSLIISTLFGCEKKEEQVEQEIACALTYQNNLAVGKVGGENVTFVQGKMDEPSSLYDEVSITLYEKAFNDKDCYSLDTKQKHTVMFRIPTDSIGYHKLGWGENESGMSITFSNGIYSPDNNMSDCGFIEIFEYSDSIIKGRLLSKYDDDNFINGKFSAKTCGW